MIGASTERNIIRKKAFESRNFGFKSSTANYGAQNETYIEGWEKKTSNLLIYKRLCNV